MRNVKCLELLPNSIRTVRKDHKGYKDRGYFTEGNEGFVGRIRLRIREPFVSLCKNSSVFAPFVIFSYCDLRFLRPRGAASGSRALQYANFCLKEICGSYSLCPLCLCGEISP